RKALRDIRDCRSAALGGRVQQCDRCGHRVILYNSCRNRHCPKCQATARARWLAQREAELLPVPYFHVVFTLPSQIGRVAIQNPTQIYNMLFRAAASTLLETAADPRLLGAAIGFLAALHTWGQNLHLHPHLHAWCPAAASRSTARAGSVAENPPSSCPCACSAIASENPSCDPCGERFTTARFTCMANSNLCRNPRPSKLSAIRPLLSTGSFTSNRLSADPAACCSIWPAILTASPSPTIACARLKTAA